VRDDILRAIQAAASPALREWMDVDVREVKFAIEDVLRKMKGAPVIGNWAKASDKDGAGYFSTEAWRSAGGETRGNSRVVLAWMRPSDFLYLARTGEEEHKTRGVDAVMASGTLLESIPFLSVDSGEDDIRPSRVIAKVYGHEGRHRARALQDRGVLEMPVLLRHRWHRWSTLLPVELAGEKGSAADRMGVTLFASNSLAKQ